MAKNGHITQFNKTAYEDLIKYVTSIDGEINTNSNALGPATGVKLDGTLSTTLKPGSQNWDVAKNLVAQAGALGDSIHTQYVSLEAGQSSFAKALKNAQDVFEETSDLSTYDASKFSQQFPDIGAASATTTTA